VAMIQVLVHRQRLTRLVDTTSVLVWLLNLQAKAIQFV
jgi:hypothetical protein